MPSANGRVLLSAPMEGAPLFALGSRVGKFTRDGLPDFAA